MLLPEPLLALFWCELVKSLSLFLSQKGFMVIVKVLSIIVLSAAERFIVVHTVLLVCGFAGGVNHAESKTHDEWPQLHPVHVQAPSRAGVWRGEKKSPKSHCHPPKPISLSWHESMQSVLILSFDFIHSLLVASIWLKGQPNTTSTDNLSQLMQSFICSTAAFWKLFPAYYTVTPHKVLNQNMLMEHVYCLLLYGVKLGILNKLAIEYRFLFKTCCMTFCSKHPQIWALKQTYEIKLPVHISKRPL